MAQQECELHTTSVENALIALSGLVLASSVPKDGECENRTADGIKASSCLTGQGRDTRGKVFDVLVRHVCQDAKIVMEVLHRTLDDTAQSFDSTNWLVAEVVKCEVHVVHLGCVVLDVLLQVVQHV